MAVQFVAAGGLNANATLATVGPTAPACSVDDILICALINKSVTANTISPPDGTWTEVITQEVNDCTTAADDHQFALYWKRATASGGTFTFTKAVDDNVLFAAVIVAYSGAKKTGSPIDATASARIKTAGAADNVSFPAFDPTSAFNRTIFVAYYGNDLTTFAAAMSSDTNPDCTIDVSLHTNVGTDCAIAITSGTNDGSNIAARTWASASSADAGSTGVVFALVAEPVCVLSGTITSTTENDIVAGGKTIILTLTDDNWIAAGGSFDAQRDEIIAGLDSGGSEAAGWDAVPKVSQSVGGVVRTSNTVVTITLDAFASYSITANETITATIPATATVGSYSVIAAPTFTITNVSSAFVKDVIGCGIIPWAR